MSRRSKILIGVIAAIVGIALAIVIPLSLSNGGEKRALALEPTSVVPPTATTLPQPTETPRIAATATATPRPVLTPTAIVVPTATVIIAPSPTSIPTVTPEPTATGTPTPTPGPITMRFLAPLFTLQQGESKAITLPSEPAGTLVFDFESNAPVELQIEYKGELVFLQRCKDPRDSTKPFTFFVYVPLEISPEKPKATFTFTNSCEAPSAQVSAGYAITFQP